jgi:hypothetical protein
MTGKVDFVIQRNATFNRLVIWSSKDPDTEETIPINVAGFKALMQCRPYIGGPVICELSTDADNNRISVGNTNGEIRLLIDENDTLELPIGSYFFDMYVYDTLGTAFKLLEGKFIVVDTITGGKPDLP